MYHSDNWKAIKSIRENVRVSIWKHITLEQYVTLNSLWDGWM